MRQQPDVLAGTTVHEVWCSAAAHLLAHGDRLNLIAHISGPAVVDDAELRRLDPAAVDPDVMSVFDVATTIFPRYGRHWALGPAQFAQRYLPIYARLKRRSGGGWGFYFQRLASFGNSQAPQLARLVDGLSAWGRNHHGAFVIHLSSAETDRPRPQGGPCWQYCQLMADHGVLSMTAVYRSHDYFQKALGNFVGLGRLLAYVCSKTGHEMGSLTCVSTYAFLGSQRNSVSRLLRERLSVHEGN
jgi:hypothetical protein